VVTTTTTHGTLRNPEYQTKSGMIQKMEKTDHLFHSPCLVMCLIQEIMEDRTQAAWTIQMGTSLQADRLQAGTKHRRMT